VGRRSRCSSGCATRSEPHPLAAYVTEKDHGEGVKVRTSQAFGLVVIGPGAVGLACHACHAIRRAAFCPADPALGPRRVSPSQGVYHAAQDDRAPGSARLDLKGRARRMRGIHALPAPGGGMKRRRVRPALGRRGELRSARSNAPVIELDTPACENAEHACRERSLNRRTQLVLARVTG
jgi:hypothetical protein